MSDRKIYAVPNVQTPNTPVRFNADVCVGCNRCVEICPLDVFIPNPEKGKPPIVLHPEECWLCGVCVTECRNKGAISFNYSMPLKPRWRDKETGEVKPMK